MALSGYSGTPLIKKLGIGPATKIRLVGDPSDYFELLGELNSRQVVKTGAADLAHVFATDRQELERIFQQLISELPATAVIWISWYKKTAKMPTDINENVIREIVLPMGWVDVKVCSVSGLWSGLKIVKRKINR